MSGVNLPELGYFEVGAAPTISKQRADWINEDDIPRSATGEWDISTKTPSSLDLGQRDCYTSATYIVLQDSTVSTTMLCVF